MEGIVIYLIYILALVAVIYIFNYFHVKLEILRTKHKVLKDLLDKNYETDRIDLTQFFK